MSRLNLNIINSEINGLGNTAELIAEAIASYPTIAKAVVALIAGFTRNSEGRTILPHNFWYELKPFVLEVTLPYGSDEQSDPNKWVKFVDGSAIFIRNGEQETAPISVWEY